MAGMSLSLSLGLGPSSGGAASYSAEATAYFAAMSVQPDATRKGLLANCIDAIVAGGAWTPLDGLTITAMHNEQAARVDARNPARIAGVAVAPTFLADRGYTSNGTSQYLTTGFNPSTAGGAYTMDACSMGVWVGTDVNNGAQFEMGNSNATINTRSSTTLSTTIQSAATTNFAGATTSVGLSAWTRNSSSLVSGYKNGALLLSTTSTSTALRNAEFLICAVNSSTTGTVTPGNYTTRRIQALYYGGALTTGQHLTIYNALAAYMAAVGA